MRSLEFFYFDAGGGHRNAALALKESIARYYSDWQVELVDLQQILKPIDPVHIFTDDHYLQDVYNGLLKRGWTYGSASMVRILHEVIKLSARLIEKLMEKHWEGRTPDLVVSMIPHFNRPMACTLRRTHPGTPYVTIMTDLADCPPAFWQDTFDHDLICGSDYAYQQAARAGYAPDRVYKTSGMILKPKFYENEILTPAARQEERRTVGLDPDRPTALIMFGGYGAKMAHTILAALERETPTVQSIVLCGHNDALRRALMGRPSCYAVGFTNAVPHYMQLADFFIGKPGAGSVSEALHMGLPVILECNARTMPQEYYTTVWVKEQELGFIISSFARTGEAVRALLDGDQLARAQRKARQLKNRAVFEIPSILEEIMEQAVRTQQPAQRQKASSSGHRHRDDLSIVPHSFR